MASARNTLAATGILGVVIAISVAHWIVPTSVHSEHVVHLQLGLAFLAPIIAAAIWFGIRGAGPVAVLIAIIYFIHAQTSWRDQPMENANQYARIAVYLIIGMLAGTLVEVQAGERRRRVLLEQRTQRAQLVTSIAALANALEARDGYTREHSEHVARLCVRIGHKLGWRDEQLELVRLAGLAHDIGKIGVRDDVLFKPDKLSPQEWEAMKRHPAFGAEILRPVPQCERLSAIVLCHHESPDGSGYPRGLKREQIPQEALVVSVADVFSALTECRPYRDGMPVEDALALIRQMSGGKLDGACASALLAIAADPAKLA